MADMPRPRPPHLHRETTRHGRAVWYVRVGKGPRIRLRAEFGSTDFDAEYLAAVSGGPLPQKGAPATGTLAWLIARYRETAAWSKLSTATRRQRENILLHVLQSAGDKPFVRIDAATVHAGCERRAHTPAQARHFLDAMRGLFRWAAKAGIVKTDPTANVENPQRRKGDGFIPWTEEHVDAYERRWPIGTRQRVWLDVLLYTGLRRGDVVRFGRQHVRDGVGSIKTEKSGFTVVVTLPILPVLADTLAAGPCGDLTFIAGERGQPLTKESFGNLFRGACKAAGVPGSAHGVRKIAATRAANAGATVPQLEAIFGWSGGRMASLYTRSADRQRLAVEAMHKLANEKRKSIPAPFDRVRAAGEKSE
jgi:integrase